MTWWAIHIVPDPARRDVVARWLVNATGAAIAEREDGSLAGAAISGEEATRIAGALHQQFGLEASLAELPDADWSIRWREGLEPRRVGRLLIVPTWRRDAAPEITTRVVIDPENAFGSGEHGSTRGALALLDRHLQPGMRVLDLGSGSGILSVAAVVLGARTAIGIECDAEANTVAERNAESNGVSGSVSFLTGDAATLAPVAGPADLILSNILRTVNVTLLPAIRQSLAPGGIAIFAGMEEPESELFRGPLREAGFSELDDWRDAGWWSVAARHS
ncbi:MAG TPA: 50S ribosomal protein L11 methyltransferase [Gemmatimonadales bacterium]|nr:50S ribosomal protein L11 methyltransferase [Gemmatimonadales bacterium]